MDPDALAARVALLELQLKGERKAVELLTAGMGSLAERYDALKHDLRAARQRIAELERGTGVDR